jgi:hypothetical protein
MVLENEHDVYSSLQASDIAVLSPAFRTGHMTKVYSDVDIKTLEP